VNRNRLISYPNFSQSPYINNLTLGKSVNNLKLLHYTGVNSKTGLYEFEDRNEDGQITIDQSGKTIDDRFDYDKNPKFDGGFSNSFSYKNWELSFLFYFRKQKGYNALAFASAGGTISNQPLDVFNNHWQKVGDIAKYAKFSSDASDPSYMNFLYYSNGIFTDASYIRLQNLSFSYWLPQSFTKKLRINSCKFYTMGENLLLITKYRGSDPEVQTFGALPIPKIITFGLSCNF
jgi:hypothetical protein